jgi:hypothetical protein
MDEIEITNTSIDKRFKGREGNTLENATPKETGIVVFLVS